MGEKIRIIVKVGQIEHEVTTTLPTGIILPELETQTGEFTSLSEEVQTFSRHSLDELVFLLKAYTEQRNREAAE